jgi:hypothetical protein
VLENDFFLTACKEEFMESARLHIFETYCRIHQCIDIKMLSERLNMDQISAEKWIANLILQVRARAGGRAAGRGAAAENQGPAAGRRLVSSSTLGCGGAPQPEPPALPGRPAGRQARWPCCTPGRCG